MSLTVAGSRPSLFSFQQTLTQPQFLSFYNPNSFSYSKVRPLYPLLASRRTRRFAQRNDDLVDDPRNWSRPIIPEFFDEDADGDDEDGEDRSLDLLVRFVENVFRKISKRARKALRSVLPLSIPTKLVGFSVNGVLILAFLWISKAFLEVVCTLGSVVFVSILLIRGLWAGITYLQESRYSKMNGFDDDLRAWNGAQPVS